VTEHITVAIYARVSTDEQREGKTIEPQLENCRDYCNRQGYEVVAEFPDDGVSGAKPFDERPEGYRLLELARDGLFDKVVIYCVDRLGRNAVKAGIARGELQRLKTPIEFVSQTFDDSPGGRLQFTMFAGFAEYEREIILERTRRGRIARVKSGKYQLGTVPYGYRYQKCDCPERKCLVAVHGTLTCHEEQASVVRQMFEWAASGQGDIAIATRLNKQAVPPPGKDRKGTWERGKWQPQTVLGILTAQRYTGETPYAESPDLIMRCLPLVERNVWLAAQRERQRRRADNARNSVHFFLLRGLVRCRVCGSGYMTRTSRGHKFYRCLARATQHYAPNPEAVRRVHEGTVWSIRAEALEPLVKEAVRALHRDPERWLRNAQLSVQAVAEQASEAGQRVAALERRLEELAREELWAAEQAQKGNISEAVMVQLIDQARAERADVEHGLKLAQQAADGVDWARELAGWMNQMMAPKRVSVWTDEQTGEPVEPTDAEWREKVREVVERVVVEADGSVTLEGPFSLAQTGVANGRNDGGNAGKSSAPTAGQVTQGPNKVLYCAQGSIRFDLPASGESFELHPGDRIDISPGTHHSALVGPEGVTCVEAARSA